MKIGIFLGSMRIGGAEKSMINLAEGLSKNNQVTLFVYKNHESKNKIYTPSNLSFEIVFLKESFFSFLKEVRSREIERILTTMTKYNVIIPLLLRLTGYNGTIVVRESSIRTHTSKEKFESKTSVYFYHKIITFVYNKLVDYVVVLSQDAKKDLICNIDIDEEKIFIIGNPINFKIIDDQSKLKNEINLEYLQEYNMNILNVANLRSVKGHIYALKIIQKLQNERNTKYSLTIIGEGKERKNLEDYVKKHHIKNVYFLGSISNPYSIWFNYDLYIHTSKWEGFGHSLIESIHLGVPVISFDSPGGIKDILGTGNWALVPCFDIESFHCKIKEFTNLDNVKRKEIVLEQQAKIRMYDYVLISKKYEELL